MEEKNIRSQVEAILFASGEPVAIDKLAKTLNLSEEEIQEAIWRLKAFYQENKSGLEIVEKSARYQLVSAKIYGELVAKFIGKQLSEELSAAAAEVLAVIAYRGPITRVQIEQIRGVNCSFTLRNLCMRGLVDRKDNPQDSRSFIYDISFEFLKSLGLDKREDLPDFENLSKAISVTEIEQSAVNSVKRLEDQDLKQEISGEN